MFNDAGTPEGTGVSTDDHGWQRGSFTGNKNDRVVIETTGTSGEFTWLLGYFFMRDVLSAGEFISVVSFVLLVGATPTSFTARLYNVSGTYKWRLWNVTADTQVGSDSAAQTVGSTLLVNLRIDQDGDQLDLFVGGSNVLSASQSMTTGSATMSGTTEGGAATDAAFWSAWCLYVDATDTLNEAHYPEMRLIHPDGEGAHADYEISGGGAAVYTSWDDLIAEGDPDDDTTWNAGQDATEEETSTFTTHAMTNAITALAVLHKLRQDQASKTVVHGAIISDGTTDKTVSYGSEDIGETYVVREAIFHTPPDGGSWDQTNEIDALEAGHRRDAGSEALNIRVTALGVVVVALGTTNLAPPDPPAATGRRRLMGQVS